jgi:hypothetical protein
MLSSSLLDSSNLPLRGPRASLPGRENQGKNRNRTKKVVRNHADRSKFVAPAGKKSSLLIGLAGS